MQNHSRGRTAPLTNETTATKLVHLQAKISKLAEKLAQQSRELTALCLLVFKCAERYLEHAKGCGTTSSEHVDHANDDTHTPDTTQTRTPCQNLPTA